jgi:hypothetical protein
MLILGTERGRVSSRIVLLAVVLVIVGVTDCWANPSFSFRGYVDTHRNLTLNDFLKYFPYDDYVSSVRFTDFATLQQDRYYLWLRFGEGDAFIYNLGDYYVRQHPVDRSTSGLAERIDIGEAYLMPHRQFNHKIDEIYHIVGYFLLGTAAQSIERQISAKTFDPTTPSNLLLIQRLEKNRVYVNYEESTGNKIATHVKRGDFRYLLRRLYTELYDYRRTLYWLCGTSLICACLLAVFGKKSSLVVGIGIFSFICIVIVLYISKRSHERAKIILQPSVSTWQLSSPISYFPVSGGADYAVRIFKLAEKGGTEIGSVIWLLRPYVQANYLAYGGVPGRFLSLRKHSQIVLAATGGFTNAASQPEGFTTESGEIVNAVLMRDRHGLVLVHDGGIEVLNLKKTQFTLPMGGGEIGNPLNSLLSYSKLVAWSSTRKATLFQTQLLAFSDQITISEKRAKPQLRERRILALATDKKTARVEHVIINLKTPQYLVDVAHEVYALLSSRGKKVEAILNLDVGSYDILYIYDESGKLLPAVGGTVGIGKATNLLVYSR